MDRNTNYVVVGAFVLLVIGMAVSFVYWYTDERDKRTYQHYEIYYDGTVSGLTIRPGGTEAIAPGARASGACIQRSSARVSPKSQRIA